MRVTTAIALAATLTSASTLPQVPRSVHIGRKVTVYASGRVARAVSNGRRRAARRFSRQSTVGAMALGWRRSSGQSLSAAACGSCFAGRHNDNHCFGAGHCVKTPWRLGSRVDINVCAESPMFVVDACARSTVVVRD